MVKTGGGKKTSNNHLSESVEFHNRPPKKLEFKLVLFFVEESKVISKNDRCKKFYRINKSEMTYLRHPA